MSFQLGPARVTPVVEMIDHSFDFFRFFPKATEAALQENVGWMAPHHFDPATKRVLLSMHAWLIEAHGKRILLDSCVGNDKQRDGRPDWCNLSTGFLDRLAEAGARPEDIDYVLCTHLHADHVGWNTRLLDGRWVPTFPNAKYVFSRHELEFWQTQDREGKAGPHLQSYHDSVRPIVDAGQALVVEDRDELEGLLQLDPAPGHTPGHVAVWLAAGAEPGVFTGDILHHPVQVLNPHWSCMGCLDPEQAADTRTRILAQCAERNALLFPGHFMAPHAARITRDGTGFAFHFVCESVPAR